jgi:hypothetical protein
MCSSPHNKPLEAQRESKPIVVHILVTEAKWRELCDKGHVIIVLIPGKVPGTRCTGD